MHEVEIRVNRLAKAEVNASKARRKTNACADALTSLPTCTLSYSRHSIPFFFSLCAFFCVREPQALPLFHLAVAQRLSLTTWMLGIDPKSRKYAHHSFTVNT